MLVQPCAIDLLDPPVELLRGNMPRSRCPHGVSMRRRTLQSVESVAIDVAYAQDVAAIRVQRHWVGAVHCRGIHDAVVAAVRVVDGQAVLGVVVVVYEVGTVPPVRTRRPLLGRRVEHASQRCAGRESLAPRQDHEGCAEHRLFVEVPSIGFCFLIHEHPLISTQSHGHDVCGMAWRARRQTRRVRSHSPSQPVSLNWMTSAAGDDSTLLSLCSAPARSIARDGREQARRGLRQSFENERAGACLHICVNAPEMRVRLCFPSLALV
jgi:hypothetical protein